MDGTGDPERQKALDDYKTRLLALREQEAKLKALRMDIKGLQHDFETTEDNIKALQSVGQIIGEVLKQLDDERFIVKASSGPRYVVGCRSKVDKLKLKQGTRVALVSRTWHALQGFTNFLDVGHDHPNYHAHAASRSRSSCLQHVP